LPGGRTEIQISKRARMQVFFSPRQSPKPRAAKESATRDISCKASGTIRDDSNPRCRGKTKRRVVQGPGRGKEA